LGLKDLFIRKKKGNILFAKSLQKLNENERAIHAKAMLGNPIFNEAIQEMEQELLQMWGDSLAEDVNGREDIHRTFKLIQDLKLKFEVYANQIRIDEMMNQQQKDIRETVE